MQPHALRLDSPQHLLQPLVDVLSIAEDDAPDTHFPQRGTPLVAREVGDRAEEGESLRGGAVVRGWRVGEVDAFDAGGEVLCQRPQLGVGVCGVDEREVLYGNVRQKPQLGELGHEVVEGECLGAAQTHDAIFETVGEFNREQSRDILQVTRNLRCYAHETSQALAGADEFALLGGGELAAVEREFLHGRTVRFESHFVFVAVVEAYQAEIEDLDVGEAEERRYFPGVRVVGVVAMTQRRGGADGDLAEREEAWRPEGGGGGCYAHDGAAEEGQRVRVVELRALPGVVAASSSVMETRNRSLA